jgi:hypothetical protein
MALSLVAVSASWNAVGRTAWHLGAQVEIFFFFFTAHHVALRHQGSRSSSEVNRFGTSSYNLYAFEAETMLFRSHTNSLADHADN